jgi:ABC-type multidrug transport system ATPase subunit
MTILVISHRMSTLAICEQAIVLQRGSVVKTGPLSDALEYYAAQSGSTDRPIEKSTFDCTATSPEGSLTNTIIYGVGCLKISLISAPPRLKFVYSDVDQAHRLMNDGFLKSYGKIRSMDPFIDISWSSR